MVYIILKIQKAHLLIKRLDFKCSICYNNIRTWYALIAQLDRVFGYEPKGRGFESLWAYQKKRHFSTKKNVFFSAKFACGELNVLMHAKLPAAAKCATHAESEFNLATPKELFSYCEAIISLCSLLQNLAKSLCIIIVLTCQKKKTFFDKEKCLFFS